MMTHDEHPLRALAKKLDGLFPRRDRLLFLAIFAAALLVHMYMFTNKVLNHDDVGSMFFVGSRLTSGRWSLYLVSKLAGDFSSPWLDGVGGAVLLALGAALVVRLFKVKHFPAAFLMGVCMVAFPTVTGTYTYMYVAFSYCMAFLLSVVSAALIRTEKLLWSALGVLCIAFAMGCYQAYFCLAAALLVVLLLLDILEDRFASDWKAALLTGVKYVACLALGIVLYWAILNLLLQINGAQLTEYMGISSMGKVTIGELLGRVKGAYTHFFAYLGLNDQVSPGLYQKGFTKVLCTGLVLSLVCLVWSVVRRKLYRRPLMMGILCGLLLIVPLACSLICVMSGPDAVHTLMEYPLVLVMLIPGIALDRLRIPVSRKRITQAVAGLLAVLLLGVQFVSAYQCVYIANETYTYMDVTADLAHGFWSKLTARVEMTEGYNKSVPVIFFGGQVLQNGMQNIPLTGVNLGGQSLTMWSQRYYLENFLGTSYPKPSQDIISKIQNSQALKEMPSYPSDGSIQVMEGVIVVKLSDYLKKVF